MTERHSLPLFPLSTVVLPEGRLPLRLFERRYLDMVSQCLKSETGFGVCLIRDGQEAGQPALPYTLGTEATIVDFDQGKDGLLHIVAEGRREFELHDYTIDGSGLLTGSIDYLPRDQGPVTADFSDLARKLNLVLDATSAHLNYPEPRLDDAEWVTNRLLELLPLKPEQKFGFLQLRTLDARLDALLSLTFEVRENHSTDV